MIHLRTRIGVFAAATLLLAVLQPGFLEAARNPNPEILPPSATALGTSYGDWAGRWWGWWISEPVGTSPALVDNCGVNQAGRVHFQVPEREKAEVLAAFAAHKGEVIEGFVAGAGRNS